MKVKTSELIGPPLNWAVAQAIGAKPVYNWHAFGVTHYGAWETAPGVGSAVMLKPYYTDWAHGGPIIEREKISVIYMEGTQHWVARKFQPACDTTPNSEGPTALIAAMRCYVASKLGDTVDIPKELT